MKKKLLVFGVLILIGIFARLFRARIQVDLAAMKHDPSMLALRPTWPDLIHSTGCSGHIHAGLVKLPDGEDVKFWFISHHVAGPGCARFDFKNGTRKYVYGDYFCCEVQIPGEEVKNREDLIAFLDRINAT